MHGSRTQGGGQRTKQCNSCECRQVHITQSCVRQATALTQYNKRQRAGYGNRVAACCGCGDSSLWLHSVPQQPRHRHGAATDTDQG